MSYGCKGGCTNPNALDWRMLMPGYFAALTILLMLGMVWTSVLLMKGIDAMHFGKIDKTDFLIPPFALFYFYTVFAAAFNFPLISTQEFLHSEAVAWVGAGTTLSLSTDALRTSALEIRGQLLLSPLKLWVKAPIRYGNG
jgi:hypothetical protein